MVYYSQVPHLNYQSLFVHLLTCSCSCDMTIPTRISIRTATNVPSPALQVTVSVFCCSSFHPSVFPLLSCPGAGHSVLLTSVLGHVQSHSRGGHVVCSSASVGHCDVFRFVVSSRRLSVDMHE